MRRLEVLTDEPPLTPAARWRVAGRPGNESPLVDAVTGNRRFVSDLDRPGLGYGAVLRPPHPGATLSGLNVDVAQRQPGVTVVRDGDFVGVVAGDPHTARHAVAAVDARWEPPTAGPVDLVAHLHAHPVDRQGWEQPFDEAIGDPDAALAAAERRVDATYTTAYIAHVPLETRAAVAEWRGHRVTVWVGTQVPFGVRAELAASLGIDEGDVRVIVPPTGSGFGGKHRGDVAIEAARLARATGRAVKVHWNRAEELQWGYVRPMAVIDVRAALDESGAIAAWDFLDVNAGPAGIAFPYVTTNRRLRSQPAASPIAQGSYRTLGATANSFAREAHVDDLSRTVPIDPLEFRLRHLDDRRLADAVAAAGERFCWGTAPAGHGYGIAAGLEKGGRVATCADVTVDEHGHLDIERLVTVYECGAVVNPDTVRNQIEGGTMMALGGALFERVAFDDCQLADPSLASYRLPRFTDVPRIDVELLDRPDLPSVGAGEAPLIAVAPAIANAISSTPPASDSETSPSSRTGSWRRRGG